MGARIAIVMLAVTVAACGSSSPTNPSTTGLGGDWTGTLEASNWTPAAILVILTQTGNSISGTWLLGNTNTNGTITATASGSNLTGTMSISTPSTLGGLCTGTAGFSGIRTGATMRWTTPLFSGNCNLLPANVVINLQRR